MAEFSGQGKKTVSLNGLSDFQQVRHCEITKHVTRTGTAGQGKGYRARPWEDQFQSPGSLAPGLNF